MIRSQASSMFSDISAEACVETASRPRVSVIIPAFNAAEFIAQTLESVFAQTFPKYEVIVVNDGSPDTTDFEKSLAPYINRLVYLKQENLGPSVARNAGILKAQGEFVAFLDSDDVWESNYLSVQMTTFDESPALDLIYADALLIGEGVPPGLTFMKAAPSKGPVTFESLLCGDCSIITSCVVARKASLLKAGLFDPEFVRSEDLHLWLRVAHSGGSLAYQADVVARHRVHGSSLSADMTRMFKSQIDVFEKLQCELALTAPQTRAVAEAVRRSRAHIEFHRGKQQFESGNYRQAVIALRAANEYYRSPKLRFVLGGLRVAPRVLGLAYRLREAARARHD
ncbi:MAG: glycosyltransferase family A protein [Acidobacteriota bacterium]